MPEVAINQSIVFFFGCWNEAGHFLFDRNRRVRYSEEDAITIYEFDGERRHIDGTLAPMRTSYAKGIVFGGMRSLRDRRVAMHHDAGELPDGKFLRHELSNGYTAISWWDRSQGDKRPGCNSTVLMYGSHTSEEMLAALRENFPHIVENLEKHGVKLVEVFL